MKRKNGFTLVELLAVIAILAILVIIAIPNVVNMVERSRKSIAETNARSLVNAAKSYYIKSEMSGKNLEEIDLTDTDFDYSGEKVTKGKLTYNKDGSAYGKMYIRGYCINVKSNGDVTSEKINEEDCSVTPDPITFTLNGKSFEVEEGTTLETFLKKLDDGRGVKFIESSITDYTYEDYDGLLMIADNKINRAINLKTRKITADDSFTSYYYTMTKNVTIDDVAKNNYKPILYVARYGIENTIVSTNYALICAKDDTFKEVADAVFPAVGWFVIGIGPSYTDINKVSNYTDKEVIYDLAVGYKAGIAYHPSQNSSKNDYHVFEGFTDKDGNSINISAKVENYDEVTGIIYMASESTSYETAKSDVIKYMGK